MERVHYRRTTPSPSSGEHNAPERSGFMDQFITQCIVSGLILAAILSICMIDSGLTNKLRNNLRMALSGQTTPDGVITDAKDIGLRLLNGTREESAALTEYDTVWEPLNDNDTGISENAIPETGFRIDEDVLAELAISENDASKSAVPEPSATPEP